MFNRIFAELAAKGGKPDRLMIDATRLKAHRTAASLLKKGAQRENDSPDHFLVRFASRCLGRAKGGLNSKLHALCDGKGRPLVTLLTKGEASNYRGAALLRNALPPAQELIADKGYDGDGFRNALAERGIAACIPSKSNRKTAIPHAPVLYRQRRKIENMFGRLKDWPRIHTRYDRCAHTFFSAVCIAATVIFWLGQ